MVLQYDPPSDVIRGWDTAGKKMVQSITKELDSAVLFKAVGERWKGAGNRFKQVKFASAMERNDQRRNVEVRWAANPELAKLQSQLLNIRRTHFFDNFDFYHYDKKFGKAFQQMLARIDEQDYEEYEDGVLWCLHDLLMRLTWERLHADSIASPFCELEFQILLAGHLPALMEGNDWKSCKILYC